MTERRLATLLTILIIVSVVFWLLHEVGLIAISIHGPIR